MDINKYVWGVVCYINENIISVAQVLSELDIILFFFHLIPKCTLHWLL